MTDIRQTPQYAKYLKSIGWRVERIGEINYFIKKLPFIGSILKVQRPEEINTTKIIELTKKHRAGRVIIEPKSDIDAKYLIACGYKQTSPYLPSKTLQLDLTKSKEALFSKVKKDTKTALRKTDDLEVKKIEKGKEIGEFRKIWRKSVGLKRHVPKTKQLQSLKNSFGENALFLLHKDSGAIFLKTDKVAYYWQGFTGKEGRKNLYQYKIVWEGILWAKARGVKIFDFEGIYDDRFRNKGWEGFSHFKKSFGGEEIYYPGAFSKTVLWKKVSFKSLV